MALPVHRIGNDLVIHAPVGILGIDVADPLDGIAWAGKPDVILGAKTLEEPIGKQSREVESGRICGFHLLSLQMRLDCRE